MADAALTSKGQITIPAEIRRQTNLKTGDRVVFTTLPNGTIIMRVKNQSIKSLGGTLKSKRKKKVSIKNMSLR